MMFRARARGFTLLEFLVAIAILVILTGILVPWTLSVRERERRYRCMDNLRAIGRALSDYAQDNRSEFPRVIYSEREMPHSYAAFTGPDAADPFNVAGGVSPNDVTASLWLLVRANYISSEYSPATAVFICPSSGDTADAMLGADGAPVGPRQRSNFRSGVNLSYSYASPFSNATGYGLKSDFIAKDFVLVADKSPGKLNAKHDVTAAEAGEGPLSLKRANTRNHGQAGQYALFGDMHVEFRSTPYCGMEGDNIYTAAAEAPIMTGEPPARKAQGFVGRDYGPVWMTDSYLVPTESD